MTSPVHIIIQNDGEFLRFLRSKYPVFDKSNVFFRDLQYGVMGYLHERGIKVRLTKAEEIAREVIKEFERRGILRQVNQQGWLLAYPEFRATRQEKVQER